MLDTRRREQGRPEGPPVRYPQGSDNRGNLAATRGAALGTASGALLLTRRAHNCGALTESHHQRTDDILTNRQTPSQPQLPGHVLQLAFRTHYLT